MIATLISLALAQSGPPLKGDVLTPFNLVEPEGAVAEWKPGKTTVLCAFAYWCDTWKTQRERLREARSKLNGLPVDFLAVSVDGQWMDVDKKADWSKRLIDVGSRWSNRLGIDKVPYTLVIDPSGTITWTQFGISRSNDMVREVISAINTPSLTSDTVYLTFDDFPAKSGNGELFDVLRQNQVKASFFVIGENAEREPKWIHRAVEEGHRLEVHAWRHTAENSEPERCRAWLTSKVGYTPKWVRGPGSSVVQDFSGQAVQVSEIDPYDFLRPGKEELTRRVMGKLRGGTILHFHAGVMDTVAALPDIIERGRRLGLKFEPLPTAD